MNDGYISKKELLDVLTKFKSEDKEYGEVYDSFSRAMVEIEDMPTNENDGWIPFVLGRDEETGLEIPLEPLPDNGDKILISNGKYVLLDTFLYDNDEYYLDSGLDFDGLAWQPLPKPHNDNRHQRERTKTP